MKILFGLWLIVAPLFGAVVYQLVSGKGLGRNWKPFFSRDEQPILYWMAISLEAAGAFEVLYGILHASS